MEALSRCIVTPETVTALYVNCTGIFKIRVKKKRKEHPQPSDFILALL